MPVLRRRSPISERALGWMFFLGAMLPDVDVVGKFAGGRAWYFSGAWYGHRGASHSILGTLLLALVAAAILYRPLTRWGGAPGVKSYLWAAGGIWLGGLAHLFGDLFTPARPLPIFWPSSERIGAFSHIGWFTPYLLWLFVATLLLGWGMLTLARHREEFRPWLTGAVWLLNLGAGYRWVQFVLTSRFESQSQWAEFQRALLPEAMVTPLDNGVGFLWYWLTG